MVKFEFILPALPIPPHNHNTKRAVTIPFGYNQSLKKIYQKELVCPKSLNGWLLCAIYLFILVSSNSKSNSAIS